MAVVARIRENRRFFHQELVGSKNGSNDTFKTNNKFKHENPHWESVYINGSLLLPNVNYSTTESGGVGSGYDTIVLSVPPYSDDVMEIEFTPI
jgi:hypothetical protein